MTTSYFLTAVSHHGSSDCLLYESPAQLEMKNSPSIVNCMKDIPSGGISAAVPKLLAATVVFITYKWKHQTLIFILLGTISYMMLLHLF